MREFDWSEEDLTEEFKSYRDAVVQGARTILRDEEEWNGRINPVSIGVSYVCREPIGLAVSRLVSDTLCYRM